MGTPDRSWIDDAVRGRRKLLAVPVAFLLVLGIWAIALVTSLTDGLRTSTTTVGGCILTVIVLAFFLLVLRGTIRMITLTFRLARFRIEDRPADFAFAVTAVHHKNHGNNIRLEGIATFPGADRGACPAVLDGGRRTMPDPDALPTELTGYLLRKGKTWTPVIMHTPAPSTLWQADLECREQEH